MLLLLLACKTAEPPVCAADEVLFGIPGESTGLDAARCAPTCADCGGEPWSQPTYTSDDVAGWRAWTLDDPLSAPAADPYEDPPVSSDEPDAVCAVVPTGDQRYRLADYPSTAEATRDGARPTHYGHCGLCSTLADLAVYAERPELTEPVRACGEDHVGRPAEEHVDCLRDLGFTEPCAWIWYWNTVNTFEACISECLSAYDEPWNEPDGSLNPCLACDEAESGAVFLAVAGRTRRNTGLASSICRPCDEVRPLEHRYP